jgi:hypothetical protein
LSGQSNQTGREDHRKDRYANEYDCHEIRPDACAWGLAVSCLADHPARTAKFSNP